MPTSLETEAYRHLHALVRGVGRGRGPAGAQRRKQVADGVEIVVGLLVFCGVVARRHAFDRQLQVFVNGVIDVRNARPVIEHAAIGRRARLSIQHAAGRMRERRGVDLMSPPGVSRSGNGQSRDSNDETDNDPPEHETSLADSATNIMRK